MPTVAELGQRVKAKYPGVYDDLSDMDVGQKVKTKYPGAYDDFADIPQSSPTQPANKPEKPGIFSRMMGAIGEGENQRAETEREVGKAGTEWVGKQWKEGVAEAKEGLRQTAAASKTVFPKPGEKPTREQVQQALTNELPGGASKVFRGSMQAASPALLPAAAVGVVVGGAPVAAEMALGTLAQEGVERGLKAVGAPEGMSRVAGDVAGMFGYGRAVKKAFTKAGEPRAANGQVADSLIEALRQKALNGKQGEAAFTNLLEELRGINSEAAKQFEVAPTPAPAPPPPVPKPPPIPPKPAPPTPKPSVATVKESLTVQPTAAPPARQRTPVEPPVSAATGQALAPDSPEVLEMAAHLRSKGYTDADIENRLRGAVLGRKPSTQTPQAKAAEYIKETYGATPGDSKVYALQEIAKGMEQAKTGAGLAEEPKPAVDVAEVPKDATPGSSGDLSQEPKTPSTPAVIPELIPATAATPKPAKAFSRSKPRRAKGDPAKELAEAQKLVGGTYESYGGGTDTILEVSRGPFGGLLYRVRDESGRVRSHGTPVNPKSVRLPESSAGLAGGPERGSISNRPIPKEQLKPEDFINFRRMRLSPGEEASLYKDIEGMIARGEMTKDVEPHSAILAAAAEIGPEALKNVMRHGPGEGIGGRAAVHAMRMRLNGINREIVAARRTLAERAPSMTDQEAATLQNEIARLEHDEKQYMPWTSGQRTEAGRTLSALRMEANATVDWQYWQTRAKQAMGLPAKAELPPHVTDHVRALVVAAQEAADERAGSLARGKLAKAVADLEETGWIETATTLWKAGLLTGVQTHGINLGGNVTFQSALAGARIPSAIYDAAMSGIRQVRRGRTAGVRTTTVPSIRDTAQSLKAAYDGRKQAMEILRHGVTSEQLAAGDIPRELNFQKLNHLADKARDPALQQMLRNTSDVINWYGRFPFRLLSASDAIIKAGAAKASLIDQATAKALNELQAGTITKADFAARKAELIANPSEAMKANSLYDANIATFNDPNPVARGISAGINTTAKVNRQRFDKAYDTDAGWVETGTKSAATVPLPFINTPSNIFAKILIDFNPAVGAGAAVIGAVKAFNGSLNPAAQKTFADLVGKGSVGLALIWAGYHMNKRGLATGMTRGEKPGEENVKRAAGEQRGAIRFGSTWYKTVALQPAGNLIAIGAAMAEAGSKDLKDEAKRPWQYGKVASETMIEQPFLQGVNETVETLKSPSEKRAQKILSDKAGSLVPAFVSRNVAPMVNPEIPETQPPSEAGPLGTAAFGIKARLPAIRNTLPPARDAFGRKPESTRGQALSPLRSSADRTQSDPLDKLAVENKLSIQIEPRLMPDPDTGRDRESDEEYYARKAAIGQLIAIELRRAEAAGLPADAEERKKELQKVIREVKRDVNSFAKENAGYLALPPAKRAEWLMSLPAANQ